MADQRLTTRPDKAVAEDTDIIYIVRPSDTSADASGTGFKMNRSAFRTDLEDLGIKHIQTIAEFNSLVTGATAGKWLISSDISLTASKTLPTGVELSFNNSTLDLNGFTLTGTNTKIDAGLTQIFSVNGGTFAGTFELKEIYPEWFGAKSGDDTVDDRVSFNDSMNFTNVIGGGTVKLTGSYLLDSRLGSGYAVEVFSNTTVKGNGMFDTLVKVGDNLPADTPVFLSNSASNLQYSDFEIDGNKARHSSTGQPEDEGIDIKGGSNVRIYNMYIHDMYADAIDLDQISSVGNTVFIDSCLLKDNGGFGIHNNYDKSLISNCTVINNGHIRFANGVDDTKFDIAGIDIRNSNSTIINCLIEDNIKGISVTLGGNAKVIGNTLNNNTDENISVGSIFLGTGSSDTIISNNICQGTLYGVRIIESQKGLLLSDNIIVSQGTSNAGVFVENTDGMNIKGGSYEGFYSILITGSSGEIVIDGSKFLGTQTGVRVETGVSNVNIINCYDNVSTGVNAVDLRGLVSDCIISNNNFINRLGVRFLNSGGNPSDCIVKDNELTGATIVGTGHIIQRNSGYITEGFGVDAIGSGNSQQVVNHGLNITPTNIILTQQADQSIWYVNITSTQFTATRAVTAGTLNFSWEAK